MQLRPVPAYEPYAPPGTHGPYGSPEANPDPYGAHAMDGAGGPHPPIPPRRRIRALPAAAAAIVLVGAAVLTLRAVSGSASPEATLVDAKPSTPLTSLTQVAPSQPAKSTSPSPSPSPTPSPSPSPSRSTSASPSPSPTPTRSSTPSTTPSPTPSRPSSPTSRPPSQAPTLRYGDSGPEVEKLQRLLAAQGIYRGKYDGRYGARTESAVSTFQAYNGIDEDPWGVYGPATRRALEG
ncbi:peptidoglycan-binding domain-containing protein [Streptomyces sp. NBC_01264]|uniref:peptidoglycan-binding domain-containing protein n=1 Tax=Streptomyces sp. NBC_01264 TaxID=2903804 RepID=UPI002252DB38|nr:peptidoglycan-binding domain-containing protein [Streptomyces sp. NBC_01264]MCX4778095.1 peptidoglycan-binding protein [Streptomyces sp. NBC_01264]